MWSSMLEAYLISFHFLHLALTQIFHRHLRYFEPGV